MTVKEIYVKKSILLLLLLAVLFTSGCQSKPVYYSQDEIIQYVKDTYGSECKFISVKEVEEVETGEEDVEGGAESRKTKAYIYTFEDKNGVTFTVHSYATRNTFLGDTAPGYHETVYSDYEDVIFERNFDKINAVLEQYGEIKAEIENKRKISVFLDSYTQIPDVAKLFAEVDQILQYECDYKASEMNERETVGGVKVTIKTNLPNENNEYEEDYISTIDFSVNKEKRWTDETAQKKIEWDFVDHVKNRADRFEIEEELWMKYPAPKLEGVHTPNGVVELSFEYDKENELYYTDYVDVFNVYGGCSFKELVEKLGGTYEVNELTAGWQIGENEWRAEMSVAEDEHSELLLYKNGEKVSISNREEGGLVHAREFTIEDLEQMLGIQFEISQERMCVRI